MQVGQHVLHFLAVVELQSPHDDVGNIVAPAGVFQNPGLGVGAV